VSSSPLAAADVFEQSSGSDTVMMTMCKLGVGAAETLLATASRDGLMQPTGNMKSLGASLQQQAERSGLLPTDRLA
jgi:hypothetical protein